MIKLSLFVVAALVLYATNLRAEDSKDKSVYGFTMKDIDGKSVDLSQYKGKVSLVVNVASKCGYTPQYKNLEAVYEKYKDKGFEILAFPANEFKQQEPGTNAQIKEFCTSKYDTKFLVSKDGKVVARFEPKVKPDDAEVIDAIEKELAKAK